MTSTTIQLGPGAEAFAQGVVAAGQILAQVEELLPSAPYDQRAALFWLKVGQRSTAYTEQDVFDAFIGGVMSRQPERKGVLMEVDTSGPAFNLHDPEAPGYSFEEDDEAFRFEVQQVVRRGLREISEGSDDGALYDGYGRVCGHYRINHS